MEFIDTHAHLHEDIFKEDIDTVVKKIKNSGVRKVLLPNTNSDSINKMIALQKTYPDIFEMMIGFHPIDIDGDYLSQLKMMQKLLSQEKFIGIGEIGLDYCVSKIDNDIQKKVLNEELNIAKDLKLPVSIHSRDSFGDMYKILKDQQNGNLKGVIHCFYESLDEAMKFINLGFYIGIGGFLTFKNPKLRDVLKNIPIENIVLETDSPYLAPTPCRGQRNDSSLLIHIANTVADVYGIKIEEVASITTANAKKIFFNE